MFKILVTGGSGFLGSNLIRELRKRKDVGTIAYTTRNLHTSFLGNEKTRPIIDFKDDNKSILGYCCDLSKQDEVCDLFKKFDPDIIYHFAGIGSVREGIDNPKNVIDANVTSTANLLKYCKEECKFVLASTIMVTPGMDAHESDPPRPSNLYAASKLMAEHLVRINHEQKKIQGIICRYGATIGRGMSYGIIYDFIKKLKSKDQALTILGDFPGSRKSFTHVDDVVSGTILLSLDIEDLNLVVCNVCNNGIGSCDEIAQWCMDASGIKKPIEWLGEHANWKGDNKILAAGNYRLTFFGWKPKYETPEDAIKACVKEEFKK